MDSKPAATREEIDQALDNIIAHLDKMGEITEGMNAVMTGDGKTEREETDASMMMLGLAILAAVFFFGVCVGMML